jgi:hypothetical protein
MNAVLAVKSAVGAVELGSMSKGLLMALQRGFDMDFIVGITLLDLILRNQSLVTFGEKDLVSEFQRSEHFAPLDQIGMGLENGINLLRIRHLLSQEHAAPCLIDRALPQLAIMLDLPAKLLDRHIL